MARIFPNWLTAYAEYCDDCGFTPPQFTQWTGLSVLAGAVERKLWLPWSDTYAYYPNLYVMLVSMPADGKSVCIARAAGLLGELNSKTGMLNILPNQMTEAMFIEMMSMGHSFTEFRNNKEIQHLQNAGYFYASEAKNSLKNIFGDFIACLTEFYDCPSKWARATKKDGYPIVLQNVCMNVLAGTTFDYLGELIDDKNIMGGFASRLLCVVSKDKEVIAQPWQLGGFDEARNIQRLKYRMALLSDLADIAKTVGPMSADQEFGKAWEDWFPIAERARRSNASERMQSILARTNANTLKVAMLLSIAESGDRKLKLHHWETALSYMKKIQDDKLELHRTARSTAVGPRDGNNSLINSILLTLTKNRGMTLEQLRNRMSLHYNKLIVEQVTNALLNEGMLGLGAATI